MTMHQSHAVCEPYRQEIERLRVELSAERERCAKIAEQEYADARWHGYYRQAGTVIAEKIRNSQSAI